MNEVGYRNFLLAIAAYADRHNLPTPTDLNIEIINSGLSSENVEQVISFIELYHFVAAALNATEEELEEMDLDQDLRKVVDNMRDMMSEYAE